MAPRPGQPYRLPGQAPRLADAQWQVARELGFASWPRLKAHVDAIAFASRHPDLVGGDEAATLHLRCGNDIAHGLKLAGFRGGFRMFADPLTMGPVPNLPLPEFLALRSDYLSRAFDLDPADAQARQRQEYAGLERLGEYSRVALWCEADAYDQLFLVRVLAGMQTPPEHLELIEIDRVPGVERFVGIGQLAPELLAWLWTRRRPLDAEAWRWPARPGTPTAIRRHCAGRNWPPRRPRRYRCWGRRCVGNCMNCRPCATACR